jgi:hypothetical protein
MLPVTDLRGPLDQPHAIRRACPDGYRVVVPCPPGSPLWSLRGYQEMGQHRVVRLPVDGRHRGGRGRRRLAWLLVAAAVVVLTGAAIAGVSSGRTDSPAARRDAPTGASGSARSVACPRSITVVTATSFAPVLRRVAASIASGRDCVAVRVMPADGRDAASVAAAVGADAWIPDDTSWATVLNPVNMAHGKGTGRVIATSPLYFVTRPAGPPLPASARSWLGLGRMLAEPGSSWQLVLADPAGTGDGMAGAGGLAEAILGADGPLVSALDLFRVWHTATTVGTGPALPTRPHRVAIVPEYALLASGHAGDYTVIAPKDGTTLLNYTWFPTAAGMADPAKDAALTRLYQALTAPTAAEQLRTAGLRDPAWPAPPPPRAAAAGLPAASAAGMAAIPAHLAYHVLSTWHAELRRSNMLIVLDVSGSMNDPAPGTHTPRSPWSGKASPRSTHCCPAPPGSACGSSAPNSPRPTTGRPSSRPPR